MAVTIAGSTPALTATAHRTRPARPGRFKHDFRTCIALRTTSLSPLCVRSAATTTARMSGAEAVTAAATLGRPRHIFSAPNPRRCTSVSRGYALRALTTACTAPAASTFVVFAAQRPVSAHSAPQPNACTSAVRCARMAATTASTAPASPAAVCCSTPPSTKLSRMWQLRTWNPASPARSRISATTSATTVFRSSAASASAAASAPLKEAPTKGAEVAEVARAVSSSAIAARVYHRRTHQQLPRRAARVAQRRGGKGERWGRGFAFELVAAVFHAASLADIDALLRLALVVQAVQRHTVAPFIRYGVAHPCALLLRPTRRARDAPCASSCPQHAPRLSAARAAAARCAPRRPDHHVVRRPPRARRSAHRRLVRLQHRRAAAQQGAAELLRLRLPNLPHIAPRALPAPRPRPGGAADGPRRAMRARR